MDRHRGRRVLGVLAHSAQRAGTLRMVVLTTLSSMLASAALCYLAYFALGVSVFDGEASGWVALLAPVIAPLLVAPPVNWYLATSISVISRLLEEVEQTRRDLIAEAERRELLHAQLEWQALRDPLTGLLNRRGFFERMASFGTSQDLLVITIDVDDFKQVNDRFGHTIGDEVLRAVAASLSRSVGEHALVGRLGGDEFVAVVAATDREVADRVRASLASLPVPVPQGTAVVGASVGLAGLTAGQPIDAAITPADLDMYTAKQRRRAARHENAAPR